MKDYIVMLERGDIFRAEGETESKAYRYFKEHYPEYASCDVRDIVTDEIFQTKFSQYYNMPR